MNNPQAVELAADMLGVTTESVEEALEDVDHFSHPVAVRMYRWAKVLLFQAGPDRGVVADRCQDEVMIEFKEKE